MFSRVSQNKDLSETQVSRITGMLIDLEILDLSEIIQILRDDEVFVEKIQEALEILEEGSVEDNQ